MKFQITFQPIRNLTHRPPYLLQYSKEYDGGNEWVGTYWDTVGYFYDIESAKQYAADIKDKLALTVMFEL